MEDLLEKLYQQKHNIKDLKGYLEIRDELMASHLYLLKDIVNSFIYGLDKKYFLHHGIIGLGKAIDRYEGIDLEEFKEEATVSIFFMMLRTIEEKRENFSIPFDAEDLLDKMHEIEKDFVQKYGDLPSYFELAQLMGLTSKEIMELKRVDLCYGKVIDVSRELTDTDIETMNSYFGFSENTEFSKYNTEDIIRTKRKIYDIVFSKLHGNKKLVKTYSRREL